ncbi:MAG: hypothetical protein DLM61_19475 [Pseudonocardiales bacterium]|nr:MAG: hypothetical protein DLM61_19475 [Pseudonocardiales bacterium]
MGELIYNGKTASELVDDADEAIRGLNHLTLERGGVRYPSEVYRLLGTLTSMTAKLPQLLQQLERPMQGWVEADLLSIDDGDYRGDPVAAAAALSVYLTEEAPAAIDRLHRALAEAQKAIAWASYTGDVDEHGDPTDTPAPQPVASPRSAEPEGTEWGVRGLAGVRIIGESSDGLDHRETVARELARDAGMMVVRRRPGEDWQPVDPRPPRSR